MSDVTNIILTCACDDEGPIALNRALEREDLGAFRRVDEQAGGNKPMEADVWLGAFGGLDLDVFRTLLAEPLWSDPLHVAIFVRGEHDLYFSKLEPKGLRRETIGIPL